MEAVRCAVLASHGQSGAAAEIVELIARGSGVTATCGEIAQAHAAPVSAFILVSAQGVLAQTVQQLAELRSRAPATPALVAIAGASTNALESLLVAGAFDFVMLPADGVQLITRIRRAVGLACQSTPVSTSHASGSSIRGLVYASEEIGRLVNKINALARCDANVLILGETGTGKEVCAQAVHYLSARAAQPWVAVNCGAIPVELVESELFGHVKGAYTTALAARSGLVREAEHGTLFLDDIDCLPLSAQTKLLRFLQEREYRPVGSNQVQHADVRVTAASNCDLQALVQRGAFRADLFFRLNVLRLNLPALRERRGDVPVLAAHFIRQFAKELNRPVSALSAGALRRLCDHDWPGNVRELKHVIERAVLLATAPVLSAADVEIDGAAPAPADDAQESFRSAKLRAVRDFERAFLERMLLAHNGNVTHAAQASRKDRRAFFELMRKYQIQPQRFRDAVPR